MPELIEAYWPYFLIAFAIGLAVAWFAFMANRRSSVVMEKKDVLDEGAERAQRNEALIKSAHSAEELPQPTATVTGSGDDLTRIKGLGPKLAALLNSLGVTQYAQIAAWDDAEIDRIDSQLGRFEGRIRRDSWVDQAKLLSQGEESAFASRFGNEG